MVKKFWPVYIGLGLLISLAVRSIMEHDETALKTLCEWHFRVKRAKQLHYKRQHWFENCNTRLGGGIIVFSLASAVFSFWSLSASNQWVGYTAAVSGSFAFALASLQLLGDFKNQAI